MSSNDQLKYPYFPKQLEALKCLSSRSSVTDILYGGGKGSAKTALGCRWQIERRLIYAGSKSIIGRSSLRELKKSTIATLFEWLGKYGLIANKHYTYNGQDNFIKFYNGSEIHFFDLFDYPSDPDFQRFGGIEIMDFFIDEAGEVSEKCFNIMKTLCRKGLRDYCHNCDKHEVRQDNETTWICSSCGLETSGLPIKGLMTCNPVKNWLYHSFYNPFTNNSLSGKMAFIPATARDNPSLPKAYIEELEALPEYDRKRLLEGDWDYDESKDRIFEYSDLERIFTIPVTDGKRYVTADIAAMGEDETIVGVWNGMSLVKIHVFRQKYPHEIATEIRQICTQNQVPLSQTIVDSDGLGIGVYGILKCKQFLNGASAEDKERYENLRSECYFKLAEAVRMNQFSCNVTYMRDRVIRELDAIRRKGLLSERKLGIISRYEILKTLGHSPDLASMIMMRIYFELKKNAGIYAFASA